MVFRPGGGAPAADGFADGKGWGGGGDLGRVEWVWAWVSGVVR